MVCSMIKKVAVASAAGSIALGLMFGTSAPSYVKAFITHARKNVQAEIPIDIQIERAHQEIANLEPAIHQGIESLAKAEVEVKYLGLEIAAHKDNVARQERELVAIRENLQNGFRRTDSSDRARQLESAAGRRLDSFKESKKQLLLKEDTLQMKQQQVEAAKVTLEKMMEQKKLLASKIEQIETKLKQIQVTKASNEFNFDDTALARAKSSVADLERRLDQMAKVAEYEGRLVEDLPQTFESTRNISQEIDEELHGGSLNPADKPL